jgi:hypothetical protein
VVDRISLLDELRSGRFEASIATTYAVHFPFYETVVHRRLLGAGCLQQIVLADSAQCAEALAAPDLRPELAGSSYLLIPVSAPGAFHPKVHLLLGKKSGKVLVGSHNLTFAGFGGNAEVTNLITVDPRDRGSVAVARAALEAIRAWAHGQPALIEECLRAAEDVAPWLRGPTLTNPRELLLWSAPGRTPALWEQLRAHLYGRCSRVTVLGPFFDDELAFLGQVLEDLRPAELVVGIDPVSSKIAVAKARRLKGARFVDARVVLAALAGRTSGSDADAGVPPLHAKVLWIEGEDRQLLVTGSANPSRSAWLDTNSNAEAVLVRIDPGTEILDNLALSRLHASPEISEAEWRAVEERMKTASEEPTKRLQVTLAVADGEKIVVRGVPSATAVASVAVHTRDRTVYDGLPWARDEDVFTVTAAAEVVEAASLVEFRGAGSSFAVVQHALRLRTGNGSSSVQRELRTALGAMTADPSQIGNVMQIVEKAIFDEDGVRFRKGELHAAPGRETPAAAPVGNLAISLEEVKRRRGARKSIAERNLAVVLDLLIHRLGQGLNEDVVATAPPEVEEKDLEPGDAEAPPDEPPAVPIDGEAILRACHRKVKKLLSRMNERLERIGESSEAAASAVAQLAAVVGVLRWLRRSDPTFAWLPKGESVVPEDARNNFFWEIAGHFSTSVGSPIALARAELGIGPWQEASLVLGLLGWLGWECEIDHRMLRVPADEDDEADEWDGGWVSRLAWVLREVALDEGAQTILRETMASVRRWRADPSEWLREHTAWAEALALLESDPKGAPTLRRPVERGDLVRLDMLNGKSTVAYVLSLDHTKVFVADPGYEDGRPVLRRFATVLDWERLAPKPAVVAAS